MLVREKLHAKIKEKEDVRKPLKLQKVIDLSPLNKHTIREVHAMRSPFQLAKGVPANTWRTVTDASNGYNSLSLREEDRHLTTFITHIGKFWCNRAPQGFTSSGDGFNRRMDEILAEVAEVLQEMGRRQSKGGCKIHGVPGLGPEAGGNDFFWKK